jgi:hypothetical protein
MLNFIARQSVVVYQILFSYLHTADLRSFYFLCQTQRFTTRRGFRWEVPTLKLRLFLYRSLRFRLGISQSTEAEPITFGATASYNLRALPGLPQGTATAVRTYNQLAAVELLRLQETRESVYTDTDSSSERNDWPNDSNDSEAY